MVTKVTPLPADGLGPGELEAHRPALLRYAFLKVRDQALAEDLVQATFLAAWQGRDGFRGESSAATWLVAILKRKIIDHRRTASREQPLSDLSPPDDGQAGQDELVERLFQRDGHWQNEPGQWSSPESALQQDHFWATLQACIDALPGITGQVFVLHELVGLDAEDICKDLGISRSNYWVSMHRARLRLRGCLEKHWFGSPGKGSAL